MYLQITTRCNLRCQHCGFACTSKGEDMGWGTFMHAIHALDTEVVTIGGGEPTLHPMFRDMVTELMRLDHVSLFIATNGTRMRDTMWLVNQATDYCGRGDFSVALSRSAWHVACRPHLHPKVEDFFRHRTLHNIFSRFSTRITMNPVAAGRCDWGEDRCLCEDLLVDPQGRVWACGCKKLQFGTVYNVDIPTCWSSECSQRQQQEA